jgi:hypothetical protein
MNKHLLSCLTATVLLSGCATSQQTYLPDGSVGYNISCDGSANSMGKCIQKAGDLCGASGYTVYDKNGEAYAFGSSVGSASATPQYGQAGYVTQTGMMVTRSLFIKCNNQSASTVNTSGDDDDANGSVGVEPARQQRPQSVAGGSTEITSAPTSSSGNFYDAAEFAAEANACTGKVKYMSTTVSGSELYAAACPGGSTITLDCTKYGCANRR